MAHSQRRGAQSPDQGALLDVAIPTDGPVAAAIGAQLAQWESSGHMSGDAHAGLRQALLAQAEAIDQLRREGRMTAMAQASTQLTNQLIQLKPAPQPTQDAFDAFAQSLSTART